MNYAFEPAGDTDFAKAMLAGKVTATVKGSDGQIVVKLTCKRPPDAGSGEKKWRECWFEKAYLIDIAVPGAGGEWSDKIATLYPSHSTGKWSGHIFRDKAQTDDRRWKAALYVLEHDRRQKRRNARREVEVLSSLRRRNQRQGFAEVRLRSRMLGESRRRRRPQQRHEPRPEGQDRRSAGGSAAAV